MYSKTVQATLTETITVQTLCDRTLVFPKDTKVTVDMRTLVAYCLGEHFCVFDGEFAIIGNVDILGATLEGV